MADQADKFDDEGKSTMKVDEPTVTEKECLTEGKPNSFSWPKFLRLATVGQIWSLIICVIAISVQNHQGSFLPNRKTSNDMLRESPVIFVGGFPRSGTTLMRVMLDAHPDIRCGEETHILPLFVLGHSEWFSMKNLTAKVERLELTGISEPIVENAITSFISEIIVGHGQRANRYCNKDPFTMSTAAFIARLYKNAKFIYMVRDGRSVIHSVEKRNVTITGYDMATTPEKLGNWSNSVANHWNQCKYLGMSSCLPVWYEALVQDPETILPKILEFLELPWNENVLRHQDFIGKSVSLSAIEPSTDQVVQPLYTSSLKSFVGEMAEEILENITSIAPAIKFLGYDTSTDPDYSTITVPPVYANYYNSRVLKAATVEEE